MPGGYIGPSTLSLPATSIDPGTVVSGTIAAGAVVSGVVASGAIMGQAGGGPFNIASGSLNGFELGSGSIVSGRIASGQIGGGHHAAGGVVSGAIASGNVARNHLASGVLQGSIQFVIDGGGAALASGDKGDVIVPSDCKLNWLNLFSDQSGGSVSVGVWKDTYANYPPTSGDTIAASGVPLISGAIRNSYSGTAALSGWTTSFTKGDVIKFVVHSGATMTRVTIAMQVGIGD